MIKKYKVKLTLTAENDITGIWEYISQGNPKNGIEFIHKIEELIYGLSVFPEKGTFIPEGEILQTREFRHLIFKNYRIVYRFNRDTVFVLRIFHGAKLLDIALIDTE